MIVYETLVDSESGVVFANKNIRPIGVEHPHLPYFSYWRYTGHCTNELHFTPQPTDTLCGVERLFTNHGLFLLSTSKHSRGPVWWTYRELHDPSPLLSVRYTGKIEYHRR